MFHHHPNVRYNCITSVRQRTVIEANYFDAYMASYPMHNEKRRIVLPDSDGYLEVLEKDLEMKIRRVRENVQTTNSEKQLRCSYTCLVCVFPIKNYETSSICFFFWIFPIKLVRKVEKPWIFFSMKSEKWFKDLRVDLCLTTWKKSSVGRIISFSKRCHGFSKMQMYAMWRQRVCVRLSPTAVAFMQVYQAVSHSPFSTNLLWNHSILWFI